jgi:hypothetical protein
MSETTTEIETEEPRRRGRTPRPEREVHREPEVTIDQERPSGPSPEHVLADVNRQLQAKDQENARLRQQADAAEAARRQAETRSQTDRKAVLGEAIASAKAESEAAAAAYRAAREAGDTDAEMAAIGKKNAADYRLNQATAELEMAKADPAPQQQPAQQQQQWKPSPQAQKWMNDHPMVNVPGPYQIAALKADRDAVAAGCVSGSDAYVDFIDRDMERQFGRGHGQAGGQQRMANERGDGGSVSPAPSGGGDRVGGGRHVSYPLGDMQVRRKAGGGTSITLLASHGKSYDEVRRDYYEAAKTNFPKQYEKNPDDTVAMYCEECIAISDEGFADLKIGDGRTLGSGSDNV